MRVFTAIFKFCFDPIRVIEWAIAILTLVGGIYLFSPLYQASVVQAGLSTFAATLYHPYLVMLWGSLLLVGALLVIFGLVRRMPQVRSSGLFLILTARFFQTLTVVLASGFLPFYLWLYPLTILVIVVILWMNARAEVHRASN